YILPIGSSRLNGTRRHVRETQSSDGDATTTSDGAGSAVPRSQMRPTGLLVHPPRARSPASSSSQIIATDKPLRLRDRPLGCMAVGAVSAFFPSLQRTSDEDIDH